ncbi:uncharacterized protein [Aristolochia californica]|uniref:uncharacterized protein n=1 Tax=Aristolochia californica TaxID=171875 RepID=UPI0035D7793A
MDCLNSSRHESKRLREWIPDGVEVDVVPNKKQVIENSTTDVSEVTDALDIASCGHNVSSKDEIGCIDVTSPRTRKSSSDSSSSVSCSRYPTVTEDFKPSIVCGENGKLKIKLKCKVADSVTSATSSLTSQNHNENYPMSDGQDMKPTSGEVAEPLNRRDSVGSSENNLMSMADVSTSDIWHQDLSNEKIELKMAKKVPLKNGTTNSMKFVSTDLLDGVSALEGKEAIMSEILSREERKSDAEATESYQEESSDVQQVYEKDEIIQQSQAYVPEECHPNLRQASVDGLDPDSSSAIRNLCFDEKSLMKLEDSGAHAWVPKKTTRPGPQSGPSSRKNTSQRSGKKRDNNLHRLLFMPNGLADGTWLGYCNKGETVLEGRKQGNGIFCSCCNAEVSPSQFEAHAGWATRRQPYRHIYTSDGLTLHDLSISLSKELATVNCNDIDDKCTKCGDGGELLLCDDKCGRAFHIVCLGLQSIPEGDWYCPHCIDKHVSGRKANSTHNSNAARPLTIRLRRVVKAPVIEIGGCVFCGGHDFSASAFNAQTVLLCDQCEREFHVGCLRNRGLCDLKELPKGKWFCSAGCTRIHTELENRLADGAEMISASCITERKLEERVMNNEGGQCVNWQILSGKFGSLDQRPLLSKAAAIFRDCFDPIVEKSGRDLVPAMVFGRNIGGQDFGGMFCAVLIVNSIVVSAGIFKIFSMEVAELPLVATSKENQGKGYFKLLFSRIESLLSSLNVRSLILPAAEEAKSIWTNKFGFTEMTEESLRQYSRYNQITSFHGTSMLEKIVPQIQL